MDDPNPQSPRVALVWRGDAEARRTASAETSRLSAIFAALAQAGFAPEPCVYDEALAEAVRSQLLGCEAVLVWVDPISAGRRRDGLNAILREVAAAGVFVSGHPDVVDRLGCKAVLYATRDLGWGSDVRLYESFEQFEAGFPRSVAEAGPRVLKQNRGNGGIGVWKVAAADGLVEVQEARPDNPVRLVTLAVFMAERREDAASGLVDQAYQPRLPEGMIRCYMSGERLVGFGHHLVRALAPPTAGPGGPRLYSGPDDPRFPTLRTLMERDWTPALARRLEVPPDALPVIWDADFLLGSRGADGGDTYVLCEINASSVFPMPEEGPAAIAATLRQRLAAGRTRPPSSQASENF